MEDYILGEGSVGVMNRNVELEGHGLEVGEK